MTITVITTKLYRQDSTGAASSPSADGQLRPIEPSHEWNHFETFLANLSATFVNVPAAEVDSQIELGLKQIVEFLDLDRSGFGELSAEGMVITHSYQVPGIPPAPRVILETQFPYYGKKIQQGEVFRLPEDLPPEAVREWEFAQKSGIKSNLTIPLKVTGSVVGGIGFASFRAAREWPAELVQRLRLVGDIFTNALARKRADEALERATEQARMLREELAHATRLELISHLTSSIAHEVNQPLCAIASNAQTTMDLLAQGDIEEVRSALKDIWDDAKRGSEVIGRIRGMVKKEAPSLSKVSLVTVIEELAPLLGREAARKNVTLKIDLGAKDVLVLCDCVQLQQVVLNLLLNAVEAVGDASEGPPEVCLRVSRENAYWLSASVEDNGVGLSDEDCERVFQPLFTTKAKGMGMGLCISRSIVEAHGGKLWASKGAAHGTTFHIRLPVLAETRDEK
jgi:signal transduction histidine kinase